MGGDTFMGRPVSYWTELQRRFDTLHARPAEMGDLLEEIAILRGKLSFYESRIEEMTTVAARARLDPPSK
jgi:hypothetical protein